MASHNKEENNLAGWPRFGSISSNHPATFLQLLSERVSEQLPSASRLIMLVSIMQISYLRMQHQATTSNDASLSPLCKRAGCPHQHHDGPRRHGWCCNACRLGEEFHTDNCSGRGERVVDGPPAQPVCARVGCSFAHLNGQRRHGYCCSASFGNETKYTLTWAT